MKESLSQHKNETSQRSGDGEVSSFFLQKGDTYSHTHQHTQYIRSDVHSVLPSLSHFIHTQEHTRETVSIFIQESGTWTVAKLLDEKVTWSVTCYWTVSSLIGACLTSSNYWIVNKLKLTIAKCLLSSLHARTQPEPATRAQDQSMDEPSTLKNAPIPVWQITMTIKQFAICCSWISQTLNTEFAIVKPMIWSL